MKELKKSKHSDPMIILLGGYQPIWEFQEYIQNNSWVDHHRELASEQNETNLKKATTGYR